MRIVHGVRGWLVARWELSLVVAISLGITGWSTIPAALQPSDQANRSAVSETRPAPIKKADSSAGAASDHDEFFDPFATSEKATDDEYDPWEPFNVAMFELNRKMDRFVLKPVAQGYNFVMPGAAQVGVSNFFHNLRFVPRFANNVFQGKLNGAGVEMGRFLVNSTFGVAGFLDVATRMNLQTPEEDTGQTLGFYGVSPGPYLVLPLMPPLTLRDGFGYAADILLDPINWLVLPLIEVKGVPSAIAHQNRTTTSIAQLGRRVAEVTNDRALNLETFQGVEEATLDLYAAVRNAYLQKRARAIQE
ncbi:MAG: VacJ family lipoprotein [Nitrospirota bacterium]